MSATDLVIDIGNTRLKWALARDGELLAGSHQALANADELPLSQWQQLQPRRVALASVAGTAIDGPAGQFVGAQVATRLGAALACPVLQPRSQKNWRGLVCAYDDPAQFGIDRWLALLAAWQRQPDATVLVVSAGTALTVDVLAGQGRQARHRGGLIAPGLQAMHQGLLVAAPALARYPGGQARMTLADNSADAIASGCLQSALGLIEAVRGRCGDRPVPVLLAGGDADRLQPHLPPPVQRLPALVLEGLARWLHEQPPDHGSDWLGVR